MRSLQALLRILANAEPQASDAELLRRFINADEAAFAEIVRRHGRLVWAVCRNLTGSESEADDAFQATFLVLLRNAKKIRDANRLSSWLHGVAYKVCAKARQAAKRRAARERATAVNEGNSSTVPDSAWERALAAVHEEAAKLPETLRVPFVLCCLEGKGVTEAAKQVGWKIGTFSGRLTRAKDTLLARLDARGLTFGVVASIGLAAPPASAVVKATALARVGFVVPSSILQLSQGVIGMSMKSTKLLAAAVLLTGGLGWGIGTGGMATAEAQPPGKTRQEKTDAEAEVKRLQAELDRAKLEAAKMLADMAAARAEITAALTQRSDAKIAEQKAKAALQVKAVHESLQKMKEETSTAKTAKWEYEFVAVSEMEQAKFVKFLQDRENRGWDFNGTTPLKGGDKWVFRRSLMKLDTSRSVSDGNMFYYSGMPGTNPAGIPAMPGMTFHAAGGSPAQPYLGFPPAGQPGPQAFLGAPAPAVALPPPGAPAPPGAPIPAPAMNFARARVVVGQPGAPVAPEAPAKPGTFYSGGFSTTRGMNFDPSGGKPPAGQPMKLEDAKAIEAEIARLQDKLATLKAKASFQWEEVLFAKNILPLEPNEMLTVVMKFAEKKFSKDRYSLSASSNGLTVEGDKEVIAWIKDLVKKLSDK